MILLCQLWLLFGIDITEISLISTKRSEAIKEIDKANVVEATTSRSIVTRQTKSKAQTASIQSSEVTTTKKRSRRQVVELSSQTAENTSSEKRPRREVGTSNRCTFGTKFQWRCNCSANYIQITYGDNRWVDIRQKHRQWFKLGIFFKSNQQWKYCHKLDQTNR